MTSTSRSHPVMQARTPLSRQARPYTPGAACKQRTAGLAFTYMLPMTSIDLEDLDAHQDEVQNCSRGRSITRVTKLPSWMPSRTPSPSDSTTCVSEVSTTVTSWKSKEDSVSEISVSDYRKEYVRLTKTVAHIDEEGNFEKPYKLTRSHSAPGALWSAASNVENLSAKADGNTFSDDGSTGRNPCSSPSLEEVLAQMLVDDTDHGLVQPPPGSWAPPGSWKVPNGAPVESVDFSTLTSWGAAGHSNGTCRPCAWFWKSEGCSNDKHCTFCHSCDPSAIERRKHLRRKWAKTARVWK